jgi:hypothetical protein
VWHRLTRQEPTIGASWQWTRNRPGYRRICEEGFWAGLVAVIGVLFIDIPRGVLIAMYMAAAYHSTRIHRGSFPSRSTAPPTD